MLTALAVLALTVAFLLSRPGLVAWVVVFGGGAYSLTLIGRAGAIDGYSLVVAPALFLAAEIAAITVRARPPVRALVRPLTAALGVAVGAVVAGVLVLGLSAASPFGGPVAVLVGVAAVLTIVLLSASAAAGQSHRAPPGT